MNFAQLFGVLWMRRRLFGGILGSIMLLAIVISFVFPKSYLGEVSVLVDSKAQDPVTGMILPSQLLPNAMATQVDIISSHNVALKVVDKLKLTAVQELQQEFQEDTEGVGSIRDWLADKILRKLDVKPSRESNVINIDFYAKDPNAAATVANAFAEAYILTSLELQVEPARRQASWFNEQLLGLRKTVEAAQQRLSEYQRKENIVGTDDRLDVETGKLAEIASQLVVAQTTMYDAETRLKQMNQALDSNQLEALPDIAGNLVLQNLKTELVRTEEQLAQIAEHFGKNHPQYLSAAAQVQSLKAKLAAEIVTARGSIGQTAQISRKRVAESQRAVDEQKNRILQLKREHDQLDVLTHEVASAQHNYDAAAQRANEVRLQSQLDQSSIAILNPAVLPINPAWPKLLLNLILSIVLGSMIGAGATMYSELRDRRLRSSADLTTVTGLAVLAEIPALPKKSPLRRAKKHARTEPVFQVNSA